MYQLLPKWLLKFGLGIYGVVVILLAVKLETTSQLMSWLRWPFVISTILIVLIGLVFGQSHPTLSWRGLWKLFPALNKWYPDINGEWKGEVRSNFSRVKKVRDAAISTKSMDLGSLNGDTELLSTQIKLDIKANLFGVNICGETEGVNGTSETISYAFRRKPGAKFIELIYIYVQNTPEPASTDEGQHIGSASLKFSAKADSASGEYWTKRNWQEGLNTAGVIEIKKSAV